VFACSYEDNPEAKEEEKAGKAEGKEETKKSKKDK